MSRFRAAEGFVPNNGKTVDQLSRLYQLVKTWLKMSAADAVPATELGGLVVDQPVIYTSLVHV